MKIPQLIEAVDRLHEPSWKKRHENKCKAAKSHRVDIVLAGDSVTENLETLRDPVRPERNYARVWERYYAMRNPLNLGFSGDGTQHLLWRITNGEIDGINPKLAIVLIGTNDINYLGKTAEYTVAAINTNLVELRRRLPRTAILLLGILPCDRGDKELEEIRKVNSALAGQYGRGQVSPVVYKDVSNLFFKNGTLDTSLFHDPMEDPPGPALHPTPDGMTLLAEELEPEVSVLLGERPAALG